jgi:hypothetical protein
MGFWPFSQQSGFWPFCAFPPQFAAGEQNNKGRKKGKRNNNSWRWTASVGSKSGLLATLLPPFESNLASFPARMAYSSSIPLILEVNNITNPRLNSSIQFLLLLLLLLQT